MQKPSVLYHASTDKSIAILEPHNETPRYKGEADAVFATPFEAVAAMFLAPKNIPIEIGKYGDEYAIFIESTREDYLADDNGGAIYELPSDTFETDSIHGMKETEWYSKISVKPITKSVYNSSIEAFKKFNIQFYFVDHKAMALIRKNPSKGISIVKSKIINERIKYSVVTLLLVLLAYLSTKIWTYTSGKGLIDMLAVAFTLLLDLAAIATFIKIFNPKLSYSQMIINFISSF